MNFFTLFFNLMKNGKVFRFFQLKLRNFLKDPNKISQNSSEVYGKHGLKQLLIFFKFQHLFKS